jgi:phage tail sheath protein FI
VVLGGGADPVPGRDDYLAAAAVLGEVAEVALVVTPDLHTDLGRDAPPVLRALLADALARQDRLVLVDVPAAVAGPVPAAAWVEGLRNSLDADQLRAGAVYHPWLRVVDPLGRAAAPLRDVPPSGHVAGLASRLDRQRGAQHTPANALLLDAVDLTMPLDLEQEALVHGAGLNLVRCRPGHGLEVWGGRTLDPDPVRRFVAHRRLLHRLVRAIRRVAEPLVFEPNGPVLRFALVRGISSVLLEAWRAGGLKGATPDEGFRVVCDDGNNPPELAEVGQVLCEVFVAPAAPLEFIRILLTIAPEGALEVVEA